MLPNPHASSAPAATLTGQDTIAAAQDALAPRAVERLQRIRGALRTGLPIVLHDAHGATLVALVETLTDARYRAMAALGQPELILTRRRAAALGGRAPADGDVLRLHVPAGADLSWLAAVAGQAGPDVAAFATSLPFLQGGAPVHHTAIALAKDAQALPAILAVALSPDAYATVRGLGLDIVAASVLAEALRAARDQTRVSSARLPMDASAAGRVHVFRADDGATEHYAIEIGTPDFASTVTVRLHSACFTGDVLGSLKCDCGPQLRAAMAAMADSGGVLLYLNQEGRGIGLANKMRAYALQDAGLDTVQANHWLGFEDDQRDFRVGAQILRRLGIGQVRLMTNNPAKMDGLAARGIVVRERVPLRVGRTAQNAHYLATKALKSGHLL